MKRTQIYSGIYQLPAALASDTITEGCIILEGGAFRGVYTSGVLDALMEADLNFQCTVGVSAGAMNGMNYVSGQIGRSGRINLRYRHDSRYVGLHAVDRCKVALVQLDGNRLCLSGLDLEVSNGERLRHGTRDACYQEQDVHE